MSVFFFESTVRMPGVDLPCRCVAVRDSGNLILISPIRFSDDQLKQIRALGQVTDLVAPCLFHHLAMPRAIGLFPRARVWGVPGFEWKRKDIAWSDRLTVDTWPYRDFLEILPMQGAPLYNEVEFLHKATRTLIATDLCFNMHKPQGWASGLVLRAMGTYNGFAASRLLKMLVRDKSSFEQFLEKLFQWDFERVVMSHGDCLDADGKNALRAAFSQRGFSV